MLCKKTSFKTNINQVTGLVVVTLTGDPIFGGYLQQDEYDMDVEE